jgi:hypothetical protein
MRPAVRQVVLYREVFNGPPREVPCVVLAVADTTMGPAVQLRRRGRHAAAFWAPLASIRPFSRLMPDGHGGWARP